MVSLAIAERQIEILTAPDATLQLRSLNLSLSVADIYAALEKLPK